VTSFPSSTARKCDQARCPSSRISAIISDEAS
jgi:hypothetical protein